MVSGIIKSGACGANKTCLLGRDKLKNLKAVTIMSLHVNRVKRTEAYVGELVCLCLKQLIHEAIKILSVFMRNIFEYTFLTLVDEINIFIISKIAHKNSSNEGITGFCKNFVKVFIDGILDLF